MLIGSIFRDATHYLPTYVKQIEALVDQADQRVRVLCVEGDSQDGTYDGLRAYGFDVLKVEHGGPRFGSVDNPVRWRQIAAVCNVLLAAMVREQEPNEPAVYVESDLLWQPETMMRLVANLDVVPACATMSLRAGTNTFYDSWGTRGLDGTHYQWAPPHHQDLVGATSLIPIESAGSCFALRADVLPLVQFSPVTCIRGVGETLRQNGHDLYIDPKLAVYHP